MNRDSWANIGTIKSRLVLAKDDLVSSCFLLSIFVEYSAEIDMSRKYAVITREAFEEFMKPYKAKTSIRSVEGEIIYRIPLHNDLAVWVYSTISPKTGESREKGEDAIRTVLMFKNSKAVMKESKTLRTTNWAKNLQEKIEDLTARATEYRCPWGHPLVKRRGRGGKGSFYGCAAFPDCKYVYKGEKRLSDLYDSKNIPPKVK